ncbi:MAG: hypothetical protein NT027_00775 [Proteobacteria bacterium]|nr:hypothetical protein [Pseudomonadota bacterium]
MPLKFLAGFLMILASVCAGLIGGRWIFPSYGHGAAGLVNIFYGLLICFTLGICLTFLLVLRGSKKQIILTIRTTFVVMIAEVVGGYFLYLSYGW